MSRSYKRTIKLIEQLRTIKQKLVDALTEKGETVSMNDSLDTLATKACEGGSVPEDAIVLSELTNYDYIFAGVSRNHLISMADTSKATSMCRTFYGNYSITTIPRLDTSKVRAMEFMFYNCSSLTTIPQLDTSKVTNMYGMFEYCDKLTTIPQLDTSKVTSMSFFVYNCGNLNTFPALDLSNATSMRYLVSSCKKLTTIPELDTSKATDMYGMFSGCTSLTAIHGLNLVRVTLTGTMFNDTKALTNLVLKNIPISIQVGSGTSYGHLLTMDSLLCLLNETRYYTDKKTRKLTVGTANMEKFTGDYEYVKKVGTILDVDDNEIPELTEGCKIPVVWCASTDEGALTVSNYLKEKGWTIA